MSGDKQSNTDLSVSFDLPDFPESSQKAEPADRFLATKLGAPAKPADIAPPPFVEEHDMGHDDGDGADPEHNRPVPRITIHAYIHSSEIRHLLQSAMVDRRLAKANWTIYEGGIDAATTAYQSVASPSLLILSAKGDRAQLLRQIDELAQYCDESTKVLVIGETNDIKLYRELMKRGVSEYIVPPFKPIQIIHAISGLYSDPAQPFFGKMIAVIGARGGVGSSTIAHNLAWSMAERVMVATTLVDLDFSFGTTGLDFNQDSTGGLTDALMAPERADSIVLDRLLTRVTDRLGAYVAPALLDREYDIATDHFETILDRVRGAVPYVVVDLPHAWSAWVKHILLSADDVIIVCTPDLASLRNGRNIFDLVRTARPHDPPPRVIVNMTGMPKRPEVPLKDFAEAIGTQPMLVLPFDGALFGVASNNGQMLYEVAPTGRAAMAIEQIASQIAGKAIEVKKPGLLDKFIKTKRAG